MEAELFNIGTLVSYVHSAMVCEKLAGAIASAAIVEKINFFISGCKFSTPEIAHLSNALDYVTRAAKGKTQLAEKI